MHPENFWTGRVRTLVDQTPIIDIHTHLYDPGFRSLLLRGIDDLLTYHYLVSEVARQTAEPLDRFWAAPKKIQAEKIWQSLFVEQSPVSEACRGVITTLNALGLDPRQRDLEKIRNWFGELDPEEHVDRVLQLSRVREVYMTNSPFDDEEIPYWKSGARKDPRFVACLRIDPLLLEWQKAVLRIRDTGCEISANQTPENAKEARRFLADWTRRMDSRYCMVSLPPDFQYPGTTDTGWVLDNVVLPHCHEFGQPFALMLGVKRGVNPSLRLAGDGVGRSNLESLQALCCHHPDNRFLATCLSRENQHELTVLARKFPNLHPFGCWWFMNTPSLMTELTDLRLELLGPSFTAQHSDARVLDQLIYKWAHTREVLAGCLARRYERLEASGWVVTDDEIRRDASEVLGGTFERFLARPRTQAPE